MTLVKTIQFEAQSSRIWVTLNKKDKVYEFKIDLETPVNYAPPIEEMVKKEPKLRQQLILAYQIQGLLEEGKARDLKQVATWLNLGHIKMYLLMNMTLLVPSIQEEILFSNAKLIRLIPEYKMNEIAREASWDNQKKMWQEVIARRS